MVEKKKTENPTYTHNHSEIITPAQCICTNTSDKYVSADTGQLHSTIKDRKTQDWSRR